jgi:hypothetical protein
MRLYRQLAEELDEPQVPARPAFPNPSQEEEGDEEQKQTTPILPGMHETKTQVATLNTTRAVLVSVVNALAAIIEAYKKAEGMSTKPEVTSQVSDVHTSALKLAATVHKLTQELGQ